MNTECIQTITANISIRNSLATQFRVFLVTDIKGNQWLPLVLVVSRGNSNPLDYCEDVIKNIKVFLDKQGLEINKCRFLIDLMEYLGIRVPYLFHWDIKLNDCIYSTVTPVPFDELSDDETFLVKSYYEDRWSIFTDSILTNEEKAELISNALTSSVFDEIGAEGINASIRFKLLEAIQKGIGFDLFFNQIDNKIF